MVCLLGGFVALDPNSPCSTCAFGKSGGAADEVQNRLRGQVCARAGIPFFCHHTRSGPEYDWTGDPLGPMSIPIEERRICAGWKVATAELAKRPGGLLAIDGLDPDDAATLRLYQKWLGNEALKHLDEFLSAKDPHAKRIAHAKMDDAMRAVFGKEEREGNEETT